MPPVRTRARRSPQVQGGERRAPAAVATRPSLHSPLDAPREILALQQAAGNRAVARMIEGGARPPALRIQRMASIAEAQAEVPVSEREELVQIRTSIINMIREYHGILDGYEANFPQNPAQLRAGLGDRYFQKSSASMVGIIKSIISLLKQFRSAETKRAREVTFGKKKHTDRVAAIEAFAKKIDREGNVEKLLTERHHQKYMEVMSGDMQLSFLTGENRVGGVQEGAAQGGIHTLGKGQMGTTRGLKTGYMKGDKGESDDAGSGIDVKNFNAKQSMRGALTFEVSDLIGLGIIPYTALTKDKGPDGKVKTGQFMEEAKGYSGQGKVLKEQLDDDTAQGVKQSIALLKDPNAPPKARDDAKRDLGIYLHGVKEVDGKVYKLDTVVTDIDWTAPELQRDLSTLQIFDIIISHADRHAENYIVDYDPKKQTYGGVKGIDNDSAWGSRIDKAMLENKGDWGAGRYMKTPGLPPILDAETALKILNTDWKMVELRMQKYAMSPAEIKAAESRWFYVRDHVKSLVHAQKIATSNIPEGEQVFTWLALYDAMGEPLPGNIMQLTMMKWGKETMALQTSDNSYTGKQQSFKDEKIKTGGKMYKPWEKD